MSIIRHIVFLSLILALQGCKSEAPDTDFEAKALKIINTINDSTLKVFKEWNYFSRGGDNWEKLVADTVQYTVNYGKQGDTTHIFVYRAEWFAIEFECNYLLNHSNFYMFDFANYNDSMLLIVGAGNDGKDTLIESNLKAKDVFKTKNPFVTFKELTDLKNKLNVFGIAYMKKAGGFFQFFLSAQIVLTYLPDNTALDELWTNEMAKGKLIKPHWNLRVLN